MGVPKFFRYISERYPSLSTVVKKEEIPEIDNMYLDVNGIIHMCSHPNDFDIHFRISETEAFKAICHYIEVLFNLIKPRKLFFMAVDGVAPRAKMNQQRCRRFRAAKEAEALERKARKNGEVLPVAKRFDSNCITPGTVFMNRLNEHFKYFINSKITNDPGWQKCTVVFSGHETPGEGEHKIMDYIRYLKTQPNYDPNTRHCLYGLDADLIMLGLITHESNFCLLREEVKYGRKQKRTLLPEETKFYLLHLSLFREYLNLEFQSLKHLISFEYDIESIIDDWILMGFLVGNDFLPNLPNFDIKKRGLEVLYATYKQVLPKLDGYLHENGNLNLPRFKVYLTKLAKFDLLCFKFPHDKKKRNEDNTKFEAKMAEMFNEKAAHKDKLLLPLFHEFKTVYYQNKFKQRQVDDTFLQQQAEYYIQGIQWNLHYYYHGCQSWSWFYPNHYCPFVSDVANFGNVKLNFEMGQPSLPFHQLLAVLPAASKELLPRAYQDLMTSKHSPIIDFYPTDFGTDLNGKTSDWEAVVLIPFIEEDRLLSAINENSEGLTKEEVNRNRCSPISIYTYSRQSVGSYPGPDAFPEIPSNHAFERNVWPKDITVDKAILQNGLRSEVNNDFYISGLPSLQFIPHTASLKKQGIRVFEQASRGDNLILKITNETSSNAEEVAKELLEQVIHVGWPHMVEAKVTQVMDKTTQWSLADGKITSQPIEYQTFLRGKKAVHNEYLDRKGIQIGEINVLIYASRLEKKKLTFQNEEVVLEKVWYPEECPYALQTIVKDLPVMPPKQRIPKTLEELFPTNSLVFVVNPLYYGCLGKVIDIKDGKVTVEFSNRTDVKINKEQYLATSSNDTYMTTEEAVKRQDFLNFMTYLKVTGNLFLEDKFGEVHNVGLDLQRFNEELPGYLKRDGKKCLFTENIINLVNEYRFKFPELFFFIDFFQESYYLSEEVFPNSGSEKIEEIKAWLKRQKYNQAGVVECVSDCISLKAVAQLECVLQKAEVTEWRVRLEFSPDVLYPVNSPFENFQPGAKKHLLLDRIVFCRSYQNVPLGSRGFIIGISNGLQSTNNTFNIIFDKCHLGAPSFFDNKPYRAYKISENSIINISDGRRRYNLTDINNQPSTSASVKSNVNQSKSFSIRHFLTRNSRRRWMNFPSATNLKYEVDQAEEMIKMKQNNSEDLYDHVDLDAAVILHREENSKMLLRYHVLKGWPLPYYNIKDLGNGAVRACVILPNCQVYYGFPSVTIQAAQDSAAIQACLALGLGCIGFEKEDGNLDDF